ncbi:hypothetical protein Tco_0590331 [Tanacetum coccineum]
MHHHFLLVTHWAQVNILQDILLLLTLQTPCPHLQKWRTYTPSCPGLFSYSSYDDDFVDKRTIPSFASISWDLWLFEYDVKSACPLYGKLKKRFMLLNLRDLIESHILKHVYRSCESFVLSSSKHLGPGFTREAENHDGDLYLPRQTLIVMRSLKYLKANQTRLIFLECKKQTIVATSSTRMKQEYDAAANCCGQVSFLVLQEFLLVALLVPTGRTVPAGLGNAAPSNPQIGPEDFPEP